MNGTSTLKIVHATPLVSESEVRMYEDRGYLGLGRASRYYIHLGKYLEPLFRDSLHSITILDVGCGSGTGLLYLKDRYGLDFYGIDPDIDELLRINQYSTEPPQWWNVGDGEIRERLIDLRSNGKLINDYWGNVIKYNKDIPDGSIDAIVNVYSVGMENHEVNPTVDIAYIRKILKEPGYFLTVANGESWLIYYAVHKSGCPLLFKSDNEDGNPLLTLIYKVK